MTNRDMENFVKYFMGTLQMGNTFLDKREQRAIQIERNRILALHNASTEKDRDRRTGAYESSVVANNELARAKAKKALTGGAGAPAATPGADVFMAKWGSRGVTPQGNSAAEPASTTVNVEGSEADPGPLAPPADDTAQPEFANGGAVQFFAGGGMAGDMSIDTAMQGGPGGGARRGMAASAANMFTNTFHLPYSAAAQRIGQNRIQRLVDGPLPAPGAINPQASNYTPGAIQTSPLAPLPPQAYARGGLVTRLPPNMGTSGPGNGNGMVAAPPAEVR